MLPKKQSEVAESILGAIRGTHRPILRRSAAPRRLPLAGMIVKGRLRGRTDGCGDAHPIISNAAHIRGMTHVGYRPPTAAALSSAMRRDDLDDSAPGRRQNWWVATIFLLLIALGCVSAGFWAGATAIVAVAVAILAISFRIRP